MSYPIDLDEMDEEKIVAELARRASLRRRGLCDYCEQDPKGPKRCKMHDRHVVRDPKTAVHDLARSPDHERTVIAIWHRLEASRAELRSDRAIGDAREALNVEADVHRQSARAILGLAHWE